MFDTFCLAAILFAFLAACGGKSSSTATPKAPAMTDGGVPTPPVDGMTGNPEDPPNINRTNQ